MAVEGLVLSADLAPGNDAAANRPPIAVWTGLVALLVGEVLALTLRYDTQRLAGEEGVWPQLLGLAPLALRLDITAAVATLLFGGSRLWRGLCDAKQSARPHRRGLFFLMHLAAYAVFAWLTDAVLGGNALFSPFAAAWALAWLACGTATLTAWACVLFPPGVWLHLLRRSWDVIAAGAVIGAAAWGAGLFTGELWEPLGRSTFWAVHGLLNSVCRDTICRPDEFVVGTSAFAVKIAPSCSGYEGIGLVWGFLAGYLWLFRHDLRFPHALLLVVLGTAAIWLANAVRIAVLILIGSWGYREVALGGFHSQAGWLAFNVVALGLVILAKRLPFFHKHPQLFVVIQSASAAYLTPFLTLVAASMLAAALGNDVDWLYPLRVAAVTAVLGLFWREYASWLWSWSWTAAGAGAAAFGLWILLEPAPADGEASALADGLARLPLGVAVFWLVCRVLGSVAVVPLAEELAFRGYLTRRLQATRFEDVAPGRFTWFSFTASSVLFGVMHQGRWLAGAVAGMLYALALYRRGRVADAVVAHATTNALLAAYVLTTGNWSLWG